MVGEMTEEIENNDQIAESEQNSQVIDQEESKMSKNQLKRKLKLERALALKAVKRKREREQRKLKGKNNVCLVENEHGEKVEIKRKSLKKNLMANSSNKQQIVIDCSFEQLMNYSDINHLCKQLTYCYGANRRMQSPLQLFITSCTEKTRQLLDRMGISNWDIHLREQHYLDLFQNEPKENLVYLTSDSPNELDSFDEKKIYLIGGFVDHNHHKSHCFNLALKYEIEHCRLPINKYMHMKSRPVLTVNQVFEIICKYFEYKDWQKAFISILPKRKGAETRPVETKQVTEHNEEVKLEEDLNILEEQENLVDDLKEKRLKLIDSNDYQIILDPGSSQNKEKD
jgi:tRNA (guanine9-N1)-methyltransferase